MDVDFWGVVNGTKAFLPHLIASGDGHIVNISSLFGLIAVPGQSAYNAAKFAVRGFTEALRQEMLIANHPVKVTCVHPGGIKTAVARNATVAEGENAQALAEFFDKRLALHTPEMAAETIVDGVAKAMPGSWSAGRQRPSTRSPESSARGISASSPHWSHASPHGHLTEATPTTPRNGESSASTLQTASGPANEPFDTARPASRRSARRPRGGGRHHQPEQHPVLRRPCGEPCAVLDEKGVSAGDVVAIMLPNRVEFVVAMFAAWRLGAAVTPISPTLVPAEAAYQIEDAAAKVVIVDMPLEIDAQVECFRRTT